MPATNMQYVGTNTISAFTSGNTVWGVKAVSDNNYSCIIYPNNISSQALPLTVPKFWNGQLVTGINTYVSTSKTYNLNFDMAKVLDNVLIHNNACTDFYNLAQVSYNKGSALNAWTYQAPYMLNIPYGVRTIVPVQDRGKDSLAPFYGSASTKVVHLPSTINYLRFNGSTTGVAVNDIYLDSNTTKLRVDMLLSTYSINIHKAESTEVLVTGYTSQITIIEDGGINYV